MYNNVKVEIIEQPQPKSMRFRYSSEGNSAGSIFGVNSTEDAKTYPSIRILNYEGAARVCVSCVTIDEIPKPHPNCLVGKPCSEGICVFNFTTKAASPRRVTFPQLGIQCPKLIEVKENLEKRQAQNIDPFKTGFGHKELKSINLHQMRLCFQVFLIPDPAKNLIPLEPVVSDIICDKKTNVKLRIFEKSDNYSAACGDKKIIILCDKVDKRDIRVRFYETGTDNSVIWLDWAKFQPKDVHKQLETISDGTCSDPIPFQYVPDNTNIELALNNKVDKIDHSKALYEFLQVLETSNMTYDFDANVTGADYQLSSAQANCDESHHYNQQQHYSATTQFNKESKCGNSLAFGNVNNTNATSTNSNNFFSRSVQPGSYQSYQTDNCPTPLNCDKLTHHSCQQVGPVYTADKVIIQQFHNSNVTINQPQNVVDVPMSDVLSSEMNVF
ncbi:embryonic polarity protein dorsal-like [Bradysia coprophila]|uniref:embryonic polarity protein dorsal-like n=1 Tax=Bradysia coprophila TaxID=38358 RepID=UPI00187DD2F1|nr:embryonic polarity protein dorsal-like [Bradysia coprophila]